MLELVWLQKKITQNNILKVLISVTYDWWQIENVDIIWYDHLSHIVIFWTNVGIQSDSAIQPVQTYLCQHSSRSPRPIDGWFITASERAPPFSSPCKSHLQISNRSTL